MRTCEIPVDKSRCEDARRKCQNCPFKDDCDMFWVGNLWMAENKLNGKDSLLGPFTPMWTKPDMRAGHFITITGEYDFCCFNVPKKKSYVVIGDIYVDEKARGKGLSKQLIQYLMETYDKDIFAKCVRGSSAENFWKHVGVQVDANDGKGPDFYEHRRGKRDLGWYLIENKNKKQEEESLW